VQPLRRITPAPHPLSSFHLADLPAKYSTGLDALFQSRANLPFCVTPSLKQTSVVQEYQPVVHRLRFTASA
jgi:hypothetical protein